VKRILIGLGILFLTVAGIATAISQSCSGLRECYLALQGIDASERDRRAGLGQFTVSGNLFGLLVPIGEQHFGIAVLNRQTRRLTLLADQEATLYAPKLSRDGQRLIIVRHPKGSNSRQILSCATAAWRCTSIATIDGQVASPVEIDDGAVLFAANIGNSGYEFYAASSGRPPTPLTTTLHLALLHSISLSGDKITFEAENFRNRSGIFPIQESLGPRSNVFQLPFDERALRIDLPEKAEPVLWLDGISIGPASSQNGEQLAMLHTVTGKFKYRYNLLVGDTTGTSHQIVLSDGKMLSRPAFNGDKVAYAELFDDHYKIYDFDTVSGQKSVVAPLSFKDISRAEKITPTISACTDTCW
jgi:Tol biopolymer transport system component